MSETIRQIFDLYGAPALFAFFLLLFWAETSFGLRKRVQSRWKRIVINTVLAIPSFALLRLVFIPVVTWLAYKNQDWQLGLNYWYEAPVWVKMMVAFLLLDFSNWLWHVLMHKVPLLWRFHLVHHTDLDLDITTAFRFHFGELIGSVFFRGLFILLTGASPWLVLVYEIFFEAATQFHHTNVKLPFRLEKMMNWVVVTPRMHGIHHSMVKRETDSNYAVIFSFWDRIFRTIRVNLHQRDVVIGVPVYADANELTIGQLFKLPFTRIRPWKDAERPLPGDPDKLKS